MGRKLKKQETSHAADKYKIRGEEYDEIAIINSRDKEEIKKQLKEYSDKYYVVDYQFTASIYVTDYVYYYYSVIIFYNKKSAGKPQTDGAEGESSVNPTKDVPSKTEVEETKP